MLTKENIVEVNGGGIKEVTLEQIWKDGSNAEILRKFARDLMFRLHSEGIRNYSCSDIGECANRRHMVDLYGVRQHIFIFDEHDLKICDFYYSDGTGTMSDFPHIEEYHYIWNAATGSADGDATLFTDDSYDIYVPNILDEIMSEYKNFYNNVKGGQNNG